MVESNRMYEIVGNILKQNLFTINTTYPRKDVIDKLLNNNIITKSDPLEVTDLCYNSVNVQSCYPLFEKQMSGSHSYFKYLGDKHPYNGDIKYKKKKVGEWKNGTWDIWGKSDDNRVLEFLP